MVEAYQECSCGHLCSHWCTEGKRQHFVWVLGKILTPVSTLLSLLVIAVAGERPVGRLRSLVVKALWTKESTSIQTVAEISTSPLSKAQLGTSSTVSAAGILIVMAGINYLYVKEQME